VGKQRGGDAGGAGGLGCESAALELLALAASQSKAGAQEVGAHEEAPGAARVRTGGEGGGEGPGEGGARDLWPGVDVDRGSVILRRPGQAGQAWKPVDAEAVGGVGGRGGGPRGPRPAPEGRAAPAPRRGTFSFASPFGPGAEAARLGAAMRAFQTDLSEVAHAKGAALRERLSH